MDWDGILFFPTMGIIAIFMIFIGAIISTAVGAFVGWVISLTPLGKWVVEGFAVFGFDVQGKLVVVGASLGFVSAFFKTTIKSEKRVERYEMP